MIDEERKALSDPDMLFAIITALLKRSGGEIVISEKEMDSVLKTDMVMLYFNQDTREIILSTSIKSDLLDQTIN